MNCGVPQQFAYVKYCPNCSQESWQVEKGMKFVWMKGEVLLYFGSSGGFRVEVILPACERTGYSSVNLSKKLAEEGYALPCMELSYRSSTIQVSVIALKHKTSFSVVITLWMHVSICFTMFLSLMQPPDQFLPESPPPSEMYSSPPSHNAWDGLRSREGCLNRCECLQVYNTLWLIEL